MKKHILLAILALGSLADVFAKTGKEYPPISFVVPGTSSSSVNRDEFVFLVVEGEFISHENKPIPHDGVAEYVDTALKAQGASFIGVHIREGAKYGQVVRALDALRQTSAKSIGVNMAELPVGREL